MMESSTSGTDSIDAGSDARAIVREAVCEAILEIAPELEEADLEASTELHHDLGLDSIDLVNIAEAITKRTGVVIPDADYTRLRRIGEIVDFIANQRKPTA